MARIIMQPSGKSVDCAYGDTVLMALEKAGYALPNNCRAGACGECKVKVTTGQFDQTWRSHRTSASRAMV